LEGTLRVICCGQGHLPLDQVAQSPIQPGLEHCQGEGIQNFTNVPLNYPGTQPTGLIWAEESLRRAERVGVVQPGKEQAPKRSYSSLSVLKEGL